MSTSRLIRWSGLALLLAGVLLAIPVLVHPNDADPRAVLPRAWVPVHSLLVVGMVLALFGLIGFYSAQADKVGWLGLIGFVLTFSGVALVVFALALEAFVVPVIAADGAGQALLDPAGPLFGGMLGLVFLLAGGSLALGTILLGIATARARLLPPWVGVLMLVGGPLVAFWPPLPQLAGTIGAVLVGASFAWSGYALWARSGAQALQPKTTFEHSH